MGVCLPRQGCKRRRSVPQLERHGRSLLRVGTGGKGDFTSETNPLPIVISSDLTLNAVFRAVGFADDFGNRRLQCAAVDFRRQPPLGGADAPGGEEAALPPNPVRSRRDRTAGLVLSVITAEGTGTVDVRVSSERKWDWLEFYVNHNGG